MSNGQCLCTFSKDSRIANAYMPNVQFSHYHMPNYLRSILHSDNLARLHILYVRCDSNDFWMTIRPHYLYFVALSVLNLNRFVAYRYRGKKKSDRSRSTITWGKIKKEVKKKTGCKREHDAIACETARSRHASYFQTFHPYRITGTQWRKKRRRSVA